MAPRLNRRYLNVTICMTHGPEEVNVAVALLLPAVVATLSSAMSPSDVPELEESGEAAGAITALAPPFLEDVLIELTKTNYAYATIEALRKANTLKTREGLAQIARNGSDSMLRIEAIRHLGRTNDLTYLPTLVQLIDSDSKEIQT